MIEEKKAKRLDNAQWLYWLMVVAAIFFVFGVIYGTSTDDDAIASLAGPGEAERQPIHITIVHDCPPVENHPSASQGA